MITAAGLVLAEIGRSDRFMRFLRVLRLGLILARLVGDIAAVVARHDRLACGADRAAVHLDAVGSRVGDGAVPQAILRDAQDRKGVGSGKSGASMDGSGACGTIKKKNKIKN